MSPSSLKFVWLTGSGPQAQICNVSLNRSKSFQSSFNFFVVEKFLQNRRLTQTDRKNRTLKNVDKNLCQMGLFWRFFDNGRAENFWNFWNFHFHVALIQSWRLKSLKVTIGTFFCINIHSYPSGPASMCIHILSSMDVNKSVFYSPWWIWIQNQMDIDTCISIRSWILQITSISYPSWNWIGMS